MKLSEALKGRGMISQITNICQGIGTDQSTPMAGCKIQAQLHQGIPAKCQPCLCEGMIPDSKPCSSISVSVTESSEVPCCSHYPHFTMEQPKTQEHEAAHPKANSPGNNRSRTRTHISLAPKPVNCSTLPHWLERD